MRSFLATSGGAKIPEASLWVLGYELGQLLLQGLHGQGLKMLEIALMKLALNLVFLGLVGASIQNASSTTQVE